MRAVSAVALVAIGLSACSGMRGSHRPAPDPRACKVLTGYAYWPNHDCGGGTKAGTILCQILAYALEENWEANPRAMQVYRRAVQCMSDDGEMDRGTMQDCGSGMTNQCCPCIMAALVHLQGAATNKWQLCLDRLGHGHGIGKD